VGIGPADQVSAVQLSTAQVSAGQPSAQQATSSAVVSNVDARTSRSRLADVVLADDRPESSDRGALSFSPLTSDLAEVGAQLALDRIEAHSSIGAKLGDTASKSAGHWLSDRLRGRGRRVADRAVKDVFAQHADDDSLVSDAIVRQHDNSHRVQGPRGPNARRA
jgi:hypothetical protein